MTNVLVELCMAWLYACSIAFFNHYGIDAEGVFIFVAILHIDVAVWLRKSYTLDGQDLWWFSWKKLISWYVSKIALFCIILLAIVLSRYALGDEEIAKKLIPLFLCALFVGVLHNGAQIAKKEELEEWGSISFFFEFIQKIVRNYLETVLAPKK